MVKPLAQGKGFVQTLDARHSDSFVVDAILATRRCRLKKTDWLPIGSRRQSGDIRGLRTTFLFSQLLSQCKKYPISYSLIWAHVQDQSIAPFSLRSIFS